MPTGPSPDPGSSPDASAPRPGIAERLSRMVQLPTVSADLEATGLAPFTAFQQLIAAEYPLVHETLRLERIADLGLLLHWAASPGGDPGREPAVLMAHYDVVPADEADGWAHPPFSGLIEDGVVWGRGTIDDKGALCVLLDAVENLIAEGFRPARDVYLSLGGDEESHGAAARAIAAAVRERGIRPWLVLDEGGAVTDAPLPMIPLESAMVGVSEKGVLTVRLEARGEGGHASAPGRHLATTRIARAIGRLQRRQFPARMAGSTRDTFRTFAAAADGRPRRITRALAAVPPFSARVLAALGGEAAALVRTTVAVTMLDGGTADNVLPARAGATVNLRLAIGDTVESAVARIRRVIRDPAVQVSVVNGSDPSPESPTDNAQFAIIRNAVAAAYPGAVTVPYVQVSATDSRYFHRFAPATYRFAPLLMTARQRAGIHGVDEHVSVDSLERGERFYRALIRALPADLSTADPGRH